MDNFTTSNQQHIKSARFM